VLRKASRHVTQELETARLTELELFNGRDEIAGHLAGTAHQNINIILKGNLYEQQPLSGHTKVRHNNIKV
jgi:hypothetical protein